MIIYLVIFTSWLSVVNGNCNTLPEVEDGSSNVTSPGPYAEGTVAQFVCNRGFTPTGNRVYVCSGSQWVDGNYQCDPIYCGHIEIPRNGHLSEQPTYDIGSFIKFACDEGCVMNGRGELLCRADGEWNPPEAPTCVIKDCGEFGSVADGSTFQDNTYIERNKYGSVVKVTCNRGFVLHGTPEVECGKDGNWGAKPTCKAVSCGPYPGLNSSCIMRTVLSLGRILFMVCKPDISKVGPTHVKCENNLWEPDPNVNMMACYCNCKVDVGKGESYILAHNLDSLGYLKHGEILGWNCKTDHIKSTDEPLQCFDGKMETPACYYSESGTYFKDEFIIIAIIAVILFIVCFIMCIIFIFMRRANKNCNSSRGTDSQMPLNPTHTEDKEKSAEESKPLNG